MPPDPEIFALAQQVGERLRQLRKSIAVAESCTGGLLGAALTDVQESCAYFVGGVITYANIVKVELLGVAQAVLDAEGAVSSMTAAAMANGVRKLYRADIGISITGVAGPAQEENKPAGLTYIATSFPFSQSARHKRAGDRWSTRRQSVLAALQLLAEGLGEPVEIHRK